LVLEEGLAVFLGPGPGPNPGGIIPCGPGIIILGSGKPPLCC